MKENAFQAHIIKRLRNEFNGCLVLKNDPNYKQGILDLLILYKNKWATLEVKRSRTEVHQPNQDFYVEQMNNMSFSSFIFPENKEEVLDEMERSFKD